LEVIMASRNPTLLVVALGLTLTACATGGASTSARSSSSSPSLPSPTPSVTAAPSVGARPSPTAVPAPTYPANVKDVPAFSPLEVETYFVEPVATDIEVFYTIPADGWMSWFGAFKVGQATDEPLPRVGLSIINVTNVVQEGCTGHVATVPQVGPTVDDMATALAALSPFVLTKPPSDVTIDGFSGKHLELTVPDIAFEVSGDNAVFTGCTDGKLKSWIGEPLSYAFYGYFHPGQVEEFWLLDVDGQRLMIVADTSPGSSKGDIAELRSILDSIDIVP
jgi:hypothetical protein